MSSFISISQDKLLRLLGRPDAPALVDVRTDEDFDADPRLVPASLRQRYDQVENWGPAFAGRNVVVICHRGEKLSHGVAALLRTLGARAEVLEGGALAWATADRPMVPAAAIPARDRHARTLWVTRARPKVDRIACPWLIRRFVDPNARFLFVVPSEAMRVAERFDATAFDVDGAFWSHRGALCSFDVMVREFGLSGEALLRLATIVRSADTDCLDLAPEAPGLLAACLGLSRMYPDDLAQLAAGLGLFDAFYRWCLDATGETHGCAPTPRAGT